MGWVSDNVRKTRVTRAISAFFWGAPAHCKKNRPDAAEKHVSDQAISNYRISKKTTGCCRKMAK